MPEIVFYRCSKRKESILPTLLEKSLAQGSRVVVRTDNPSELDRFLWTYRDDSFLPHGTRKDGTEAAQPIWLTEAEENPNNADILILLNAAPFGLDQFQRCFYLFDESDPVAIEEAARYKTELSNYPQASWRQADRGWVKDEGNG